MAEMTAEQQKAIALAQARRRREEAEQSAAPQEPAAAAPGSQPTGIGPFAQMFMGNPITQLGKMGPAGAVPFLMLEGMRQASSGVDRAAYNIGGATTDIATKAGAPPELAAGLGYGANLGTQLGVTFLGGQLAKVAPLGLKAAGRNIMQRAVKPSTAALKSGDWTRASDTMFQKGISASKGGLSKLDDLIDGAISKVDDAIDAVGPGRMVNRDFVKKELVSELQNIRKRVDVGDDPRQIAQLWQRIKGRFDELIPLERAQEAKKAEMAFLRNKNVYQKDLNPAVMAGREAAARGLKKGIEDVVPEIKELNRELGNLLTTRDVLAPKVAIQGNKDVVGAFAPLSVAAAQGEPVGTAMAIAQLADRNPWFKSWLARTLFNLPSPIGMMGGAIVGSQMGRPPDD